MKVIHGLLPELDCQWSSASPQRISLGSMKKIKLDVVNRNGIGLLDHRRKMLKQALRTVHFQNNEKRMEQFLMEFTYLEWIGRLIIVNTNKYLANNQFFFINTEHKIGSKRWITFTLNIKDFFPFLVLSHSSFSTHSIQAFLFICPMRIPNPFFLWSASHAKISIISLVKTLTHSSIFSHFYQNIFWIYRSDFSFLFFAQKLHDFSPSCIIPDQVWILCVAIEEL